MVDWDEEFDCLGQRDEKSMQIGQKAGSLLLSLLLRGQRRLDCIFLKSLIKNKIFLLTTKWNAAVQLYGFSKSKNCFIIGNFLTTYKQTLIDLKNLDPLFSGYLSLPLVLP